MRLHGCGGAPSDNVARALSFSEPRGMSSLKDVMQLRVRYSETDQMGTFYNSRALEWFECARSELIRNQMGMSYAELETRGVFLPLVEAHLEFRGGARYDDLLKITSVCSLFGRARLRFDVEIHHAKDGKPVVAGYTVHAYVGEQGRPIRPPVWFLQAFEAAVGKQNNDQGNPGLGSV